MSIPDQESIMGQVHDLALEARKGGATIGELGEALLSAARPVLGSVAAPIYLGKAHDVIPQKYILHFKRIQCLNCGHVGTESKFYAMNFIRSRVTGQHVRHLVPCDRPLYLLPVERFPLGTAMTAYCAECEVIDLSHLPPPPMASQVYDLEEPRLKGQKPRPAAEKKPTASTKSTLDDLA